MTKQELKENVKKAFEESFSNRDSLKLIRCYTIHDDPFAEYVIINDICGTQLSFYVSDTGVFRVVPCDYGFFANVHHLKQWCNFMAKLEK